jgi:hypothetical protein
MTQYQISWNADGQNRSMTITASTKKVADNIAKRYLLQNYKISVCKAQKYFS